MEEPEDARETETYNYITQAKSRCIFSNTDLRWIMVFCNGKNTCATIFR